MPMQSLNPATEEVLANVQELTDAQLEEKIALAHECYGSWTQTTVEERKGLMLRLAEVLNKNKEVYGRLMMQEMGKPITAAIAEVEKCAWVCEYYANETETILAKEVIATDASSSYVRFDPLGVILAVMPWNYPFWQVMRFAAPAAMAGNVGLLKHASNVPQSAAAIEAAFDEAGFPKGVFQNLAIGSAMVERVITDSRVKAATLTGSEYAGSQVAMQSGKALKPTVLELGGSDPFVVLEDADLELAAEVGVKARMQNSGQSCIAAKRFILHHSIAEQFLKHFQEHIQKLVVGDPASEATQMGPLATESILEEVSDQVQRSVEAGAKVLIGGKRWGNKGYFYEPTILADVKKGMPAYEEEIFGPVAIVITVDSEEEAIAVANDSRFGLGSSIWTADIARAEKLAAQIEAGAVFINGMVKSDPRLPFGGIKMSGYGRELAHYGMKEFLNIKTVWVK